MTKLILLDSLLQDVRAIVGLPNSKLSTIVRLPNPELISVVWLHIFRSNFFWSTNTFYSKMNIQSKIKLGRILTSTILFIQINPPNLNRKKLIWARATICSDCRFCFLHLVLQLFLSSGRASITHFEVGIRHVSLVGNRHVCLVGISHISLVGICHICV